MTTVLPSFWDDVPSPAPAFTRWLRRGLHTRALALFPPEAHDLQVEDQERVMARVLARALPQHRDFLVWTDDPEFRGRTYASGAWTFNAARTTVVLRAAIAEALQALDAEDFPALEAWLAALHADQLASPAPVEPRLRETPATTASPRKRQAGGVRAHRAQLRALRDGVSDEVHLMHLSGKEWREELDRRYAALPCPGCQGPMGERGGDYRTVYCGHCTPVAAARGRVRRAPRGG